MSRLKVLVGVAGVAAVSSALLVGTASGSTGKPATVAKLAVPSRPASPTVGTRVAIPSGGRGVGAVATCPTGKVVTGGGYYTSGYQILSTDSYQYGNGWLVRGNNYGTATEYLYAEAICIG